jgi:hypothetical protein
VDVDVVEENFQGNQLMLALSDQIAAMRVDLDRSDGDTYEHEEEY